VEEVSLDSLHNIVKEQGTVSTITEDVVLTTKYNYSSTDTEFRGR
jgi:hypothetical protein